MKTIGERICKLREKFGFSQAYVGQKIGVSRVAVTKWESGQTANMKLENLTGLCKLFSVTYDYLIDGKESENGKPSVHNDKNLKFVSKKEKKIRNIIDNLPHLNEDELDATKNVTNAFKNKTPAKKAQNEEN